MATRNSGPTVVPDPLYLYNIVNRDSQEPVTGRPLSPPGREASVERRWHDESTELTRTPISSFSITRFGAMWIARWHRGYLLVRSRRGHSGSARQGSPVRGRHTRKWRWKPSYSDREPLSPSLGGGFRATRASRVRPDRPSSNRWVEILVSDSLPLFVNVLKYTRMTRTKSATIDPAFQESTSACSQHSTWVLVLDLAIPLRQLPAIRQLIIGPRTTGASTDEVRFLP